MQITNVNFALGGMNVQTWDPPPPPAQTYLWTWGRNDSGQLGLGNTTNYSSPKQVGALNDWLQIAAGYKWCLAVKKDNTIWSWGGNSFGNLGLGNTTNYSSPKQIGSLTNWAAASVGNHVTVARKTDGTLWAWGRNYRYGLGQGDTTNRSSPVQIGSATNWLKVSAGAYGGHAIDTSGNLYGWGSNQFGQIGNGSSTPNANGGEPSPVQISGTWSTVACSTTRHTAAIKTDGTLWTWGGGYSSALGLGNTTNYSSPKQVGALTNWLSVSAGSYATIAVKTDGTVWTWGEGIYGKLGLGNTSTYASPKQVGALTNWKAGGAHMGTSHTSAIKTDGTLWIWGYNYYGQVGDSTTTNRSSPVQIGSKTNWANTATRTHHTVAIG